MNSKLRDQIILQMALVVVQLSAAVAHLLPATSVAYVGIVKSSTKLNQMVEQAEADMIDRQLGALADGDK